MELLTKIFVRAHEWHKGQTMRNVKELELARGGYARG